MTQLYSCGQGSDVPRASGSPWPNPCSWLHTELGQGQSISCAQLQGAAQSGGGLNPYGVDSLWVSCTYPSDV